MSEDNGVVEIDHLRDRVDPILLTALEQSFALGFLGNMPIQQQIDHALGFVAVLEKKCGRPPEGLVDLGTGGGVPGLVLISCWPATRILLVDANERRTEFLKETLTAWSPSGPAEVRRGRTEELGRDMTMREQFEAVTSRSFGIPALTAECGSCFLEIGGHLVVSEPPDSPVEERWPVAGLDLVGLVRHDPVRSNEGFGYQVMTKTSALDNRYPRRVGVPVKRPLF